MRELWYVLLHTNNNEHFLLVTLATSQAIAVDSAVRHMLRTDDNLSFRETFAYKADDDCVLIGKWAPNFV